ncbi:MAG: oligopeptide/dipeptide ABC transporter ATP-binding protein [Spirochaetota bacterium]
MKPPLLEVQNLKKYFHTNKGIVHAVDDVSLTLFREETLGVVGESGCGKSTLGRACLRAFELSGGCLFFHREGRKQEITTLAKRQMRPWRKHIQLIFQDPYSSLNPRQSVYQIIEEPLRIHGIEKDPFKRRRKVLELMQLVGLSERFANVYPHEMDGGRRQRIVIARALAVGPEFIVCDEPVSALDVSIQAQILSLLQDLQEELKLTYLFITHDLAVVRHMSNRIIVMYLGHVVEEAEAEKLFLQPIHPYTQALLSAIPIPSTKQRPQKIVLKGEVGSALNPKAACRFAPRCPLAIEQCHRATPELLPINGLEGPNGERRVRCWRAGEILSGDIQME